MNNLTLHTGKNDSTGYLPGARLCRIQVPWAVKKSNGKDNEIVVWQAGKFNPQCFEWLKKQVAAANNSGMRAQIIIASTPLLRMPEWGNHALNSINRGPIAARGSAVREFYKNTKARKIIKELLSLIDYNLGEMDIEIYLCWENFISWKYGGKEWAAEMVRWWQGVLNSQSEKIGVWSDAPIGTGVVKYSHLKELNAAAGPGIVGFIEAWDYSRFILENWYYSKKKLFSLPWQWVGFWPDKRLFYEQKNWKVKLSYFNPGKEIDNAVKELKQIFKMIIRGAGASYHFDVLLESNYWEKKYGFEIPESYDINKHMNAIKGYFSIPVIRNAAQNPEKMKDKDNRRIFKAASREYLEKLRNEK